ncbi:MAG: competence protein ComEA [Solirubrobacterales bacterium]|nr:competence protein ComEA [Solirubrobacterales bacterium]
MPEIGRAQLFVYAAVAVALALIGVRALQAERGEPASFEVESGAEGAEGGFSLGGEGGDVVVDVTGAVRRPGVYRLPAGSRVEDAVARAGGAEGHAVLEAINLAARLADGQQVVVPSSRPGATVGVASSEDGPISLGTATVEQLDTIDGIGPVTAADIVEFRDEHGGLASVEQLDQVSGIGPATMEALRDRLQP